MYLSKRTEQNRFYSPNESKIIIKKNRTCQATRRANFPSKLAALNIAFNLIYAPTRREKDRNNQTTRCKVQVQHFSDFTATNMSKTAVNSCKFVFKGLK